MMKSLIVFLLSFSVALADSKESCRSFYEKRIEKHVRVHEKVNKYFYISASTATVLAFVNPLLSGIVLGAHYGAILISSDYGSKKGNVFNLEMMETPEGQLLFDEVLKINQDYTNLDIQRIINNGFESGDFCSNLPSLYDLDEVSDYVVLKLKEENAALGHGLKKQI